MEKIQTVNCESVPTAIPDFMADSPLPFGSSATNYNQNTNYDLNASSPLGATDGLQKLPGFFRQEKPAMSSNSGPDIRGGVPVRGSQPSHQTLGHNKATDASSNSVHLAYNTPKTRTESGSRGLSLNGQLQGINGSKNRIVPTGQPIVAPHSVPDVSVSTPPHPVTAKNIEAPSMPNVSMLGANSQVKNSHGNYNVMNPQPPQKMNTSLCQSPRPDEQLNLVVSQQHFPVAPSPSQTDPAGISVGASQHHFLKTNPESLGAPPNILESSDDDSAKETGSEHPYDQHKDINVQLQLNDNQIPSAGSDTIPFAVPSFVVQIPRNLPFHSWKGEILKQIGALIDNVGIIELDTAGKITIGNKRAMQTVFSYFEGHDILKRKKPQGATDNDSSYDKANIVKETHVSEGILCTGVKSSTNVLSDEIPRTRIQNAPGATQKSNYVALSPQVEEKDVDSMQEISDPSRRQKRKFSLDETKLLIVAVEKYGVGGWQQIKQEVFHDSDRTRDELKDKWRSLVKTAKKPAKDRRGAPVPQKLFYKVLYIDSDARDAKLEGE